MQTWLNWRYSPTFFWRDWECLWNMSGVILGVSGKIRIGHHQNKSVNRLSWSGRSGKLRTFPFLTRACSVSRQNWRIGRTNHIYNAWKEVKEGKETQNTQWCQTQHCYLKAVATNGDSRQWKCARLQQCISVTDASISWLLQRLSFCYLPAGHTQRPKLGSPSNSTKNEME